MHKYSDFNYGTLFEMFLNSRDVYAEQTAFIYRAAGSEFSVSYEKFYEDVVILTRAFAERGVKKGSRVMILSDNRYGWIVTDMALVALGAVSVPRGSDTPTSELEYILDHSASDFLVIETAALLKAHEEMLQGKKIKSFFLIEGEKTHRWFDNVYSYNDLLENRNLTQDELEAFAARRLQLTQDDLFTLIYTSGTTGVPKGVRLTHRNIMYNVRYLPQLVGLREGDLFVSILPSWHIFERAVEYIALSRGCCTVYSAVKTFAADLESYRPTLVATVPRLWESLHARINSTLEKENPKRAKIFRTLVAVSTITNRQRRILRDELPIFNKAFLPLRWLRKLRALGFLLLLALPDRLAKARLQAVQEKFGGQLRMAISGGGSLPGWLDEWIDAIGIRIVNAYGMTECAPAIAGRALNCATFGTLGLPVENTELRIVDEQDQPLAAGVEGEIQVKGDQVFTGYEKNEEEDRKSFTAEGFFRTGDLGKLTLRGELVITGRSKEIIVLASGENVDPSRIESTITRLPFVSDAVLVGQDKKGLGALVVPDFDKLREFAASKLDLLVESTEQLRNNHQILEKAKAEMNRLLQAKKGFKPFEKLQNIHFLEGEFKPGEELTNTLKKKRHVIEKKYHELIGKLLK
ncbi:MAG: long-chain fatty acid--CoA ligase [Geopsychrobacter sp.]|nr:long-chain fatty acid--CoA ligase [Geopsychrobacter sp.]